jgi:hypothetical protein
MSFFKITFSLTMFSNWFFLLFFFFFLQTAHMKPLNQTNTLHISLQEVPQSARTTFNETEIISSNLPLPSCADMLKKTKKEKKNFTYKFYGEKM